MTNNHTTASPNLVQRVASGGLAGAVLTAGAAAGGLLLLTAIHPFLVTSPILRAALLRSLAAIALLGFLGGMAGTLCRSRSKWAAGMGAFALNGAMALAAYAWTGWDGQAHGTVFKTGPVFWSARLPGLLMILGGGLGAALAWRWLAPLLVRSRPQLLRWLARAAIASMLLASGLGLLAGAPSGEGRLVLLGIDGVGVELLRTMTEKTELPHFRQLLDAHPHGDLLPEPPYSPPSWPTLATGKLPEQHGIDNWGRNNRATGRRDNHHRAQIEAATLFDIAEHEGLGGAVFEWPIVGREASGLDSSLNRIAVFLTGFGERLPWLLRQASQVRAEKRERIHLTYKENETGLVVLSHYFWHATQALVFGVVVKSTDSAQHHYFHSLDPERFGLDPRVARETADYVPGIYRIADRILGGFTASAGTNVLVVSDHGARDIPVDQEVPFSFAYSFNLEPLLERWGDVLLDAEGQVDLARSRVLNCSDKILHQQLCVNITEARCQAEGASPAELLERGRGDIEALEIRFRALHFEVGEEPLFPGPYITRWNGRNMRETWLQMGVEGDEPVLFPNFDDYDLLLGEGFSLVPFTPALEEQVVLDGEGNRWPLSELIVSRGWEGNHRRDGLVAAIGPAFGDAQVLNGARTVDIVPTALRLLGLPLAADMDGRVLTALLKEDAMSPPVPPIETYQGLVPRGRGGSGTSYDEKIERDLKALGYID